MNGVLVLDALIIGLGCPKMGGKGILQAGTHGCRLITARSIPSSETYCVISNPVPQCISHTILYLPSSIGTPTVVQQMLTNDNPPQKNSSDDDQHKFCRIFALHAHVATSVQL